MSRFFRFGFANAKKEFGRFGFADSARLRFANGGEEEEDRAEDAKKYTIFFIF
jgi:hypothetical protein